MTVSLCRCIGCLDIFAEPSTAGIGASKLALGVFLRKLPVETIVAYSIAAGIGGARQRRVAWWVSLSNPGNGAGRVPRNPGKPLEDGMLAIFPDGHIWAGLCLLRIPGRGPE